MRTYDNGTGFTVTFSDWEAPVCLDGKGYFEFDNNGDIIGCGGSADRADGGNVLAFAYQCRDYGAARIKANRDSKASKEARRAELFQKAILGDDYKRPTSPEPRPDEASPYFS